MQKIILSFLLIVFSSSFINELNAQSHYYDSIPEICSNTPGGSINISHQNTSIKSTGNAFLKIYYNGDLSGANKYFNIISENGDTLKKNISSSSQCSDESYILLLNKDSINTWASDGKIDFIFSASNNVDTVCSANGNSSFCIIPVLEYDYSDCLPPNSATVIDSGSNFAKIKWTSPSANATMKGYDIYYNTTGISPKYSTSAIDSTSSNDTSYTLVNLEGPLITYYVWLRSKCSSNKVGLWNQVASFKTVCAKTIVPYYMNIEKSTLPNIPSCTSLDTISGNSWEVASINTSGFNNKVLEYRYADTTANSWIFTPGISLNSNVKYKLHFRYGNTINTEKLKIAFGTNDTSTSMSFSLFKDTNIHLQAAKEKVITFQVPANKVYYIGFQSFSEGSQGSLFLDQISVTKCNLPIVNGIETIFHNSKSITFKPIDVSNATNYSWDFGDGNQSNQHTPTHKFAGSGPYSVTLIVSNQCGSDTVNKTMLGIHSFNSLKNEYVKVYPNPTKDKITIESKNALKITQVEIFNTIGVKLYNAKVYNKSRIVINLSDKIYTTGTYFVHLRTKKGVVINKAIQIVK